MDNNISFHLMIAAAVLMSLKMYHIHGSGIDFSSQYKKTYFTRVFLGDVYFPPVPVAFRIAEAYWSPYRCYNYPFPFLPFFRPFFAPFCFCPSQKNPLNWSKS